MRGGNHGKVTITCTLDPKIVQALSLLRYADENAKFVYPGRIRRYVAEAIETYVPALFQHRFGISLSEFYRMHPKPGEKELPQLSKDLAASVHKTKKGEVNENRIFPITARAAISGTEQATK